MTWHDETPVTGGEIVPNSGGDEMASASLNEASVPAPHYLNIDLSVKSWLLASDHKRIAWLYLISTTFFFLLAATLGVVMRLELLTPMGNWLSADAYSRLFTMHGIVMVFFFLIPSIPAVLGNFLLPMMLGARGMAFPRLNLMSWYWFMLGGAAVTISILGGGIDTGWTIYGPQGSGGPGGNLFFAVTGIIFAGFSTVLLGVNLLATVHRMRIRTLTWRRMPLFVWAHYATAWIMLVATPVLIISLALILSEHYLQMAVFNPASGGDPALFQRLFWFYARPAFYMMILPAIGVVSELLTAHSGRRPFGYPFLAGSILLIAFLGFLASGHHLLLSSQSLPAGLLFSITSFAVAVPFVLILFNWIATLYRGSILHRAPMLFALGFIGLLAVGGLAGLFLATTASKVALHNTYFVVAHFHYLFAGAVVMGYLGGLHFWWPKMTGREYPENLAKLGAMVIFLGINLAFLPQFFLGFLGMPRRYYSYPVEFEGFQILASVGIAVLAAGYLLPMLYLVWSLWYGKSSESNPLGISSLEWQSPSPPPVENFTVTPNLDEDTSEHVRAPA
jgi:cytochrome c oxidase subunit 1